MVWYREPKYGICSMMFASIIGTIEAIGCTAGTHKLEIGSQGMSRYYRKFMRHLYDTV